MDLYITLIIVVLLSGTATLIKYFGGERMIAGYSTASPVEQKYMSEKGIGAFIGNYFYLIAGIILAGYLGKRAGLVLGQEISFAMSAVISIVMLFRVKAFHLPESMITPQSARTRRIGLWSTAMIILAVAGLITWSALPTHFDLQAKQVKITGAFGFNINYADIDSLRLQSEIPTVGRKLNGFNLGPILKGHFQVEGMSSARLFLRSTRGPVLIITLKNHFNPVLINFSDPAETTHLYQQLQSHT